MLFYRAALPLSHQTLTYMGGIIRRHRAAIRSLWHMLDDKVTVDPEHLADLLWTMHSTKGQREVIYP